MILQTVFEKKLLIIMTLKANVKNTLLIQQLQTKLKQAKRASTLFNTGQNKLNNSDKDRFLMICQSFPNSMNYPNEIAMLIAEFEVGKKCDECDQYVRDCKDWMDCDCDECTAGHGYPPLAPCEKCDKYLCVNCWYYCANCDWTTCYKHSIYKKLENWDCSDCGYDGNYLNEKYDICEDDTCMGERNIAKCDYPLCEDIACM
eukprot:UN09444